MKRKWLCIGNPKRAWAIRVDEKEVRIVWVMPTK